MEARASGGRRKRQDCGSGEKAFTVQAPRGAADRGWRQRSERQAIISYMNEVRIPAFAKINLRLDVMGKRPDGFHELRTVFQTISLHDDLVLRRVRDAGIALRVEGNATLSTEPVEKNLVYRAVHLLRRELRERGGVAISLRKKIPAGRGLGGGSSDAAAALLGYLRLMGKRIAPERLMELAASLGADVPFFLLGGRALG